MRFEYWNSSPNLEVGCMRPSRESELPGVIFPYSNIHSKSCRGIPVQAQIRCLTRTLCVVWASPSRKLGSNVVTGVSQLMRCSSTSLASKSVVMAFVFEATMNKVSASGLSLLPSSLVPNPSAKTTLPSCTKPKATPGTPNTFCPDSMKRTSSAMRA